VLDGASLEGADLQEARLRGIRLDNARYNEQTRWPKGFLPARCGAKLMP